jgi:hypothetical protein
MGVTLAWRCIQIRDQPIAIVLGGSCHREVRFGSLSAEKMSPCSRR